MFGYERGTFTGGSKDGRIGLFEFADKGTIFLDEIGEMSLELQAKLLRIIETGEVKRLGSNRIPEMRRTDHCRHQSESAGDGRGKGIPGRPVLPIERIDHPRAASAGTSGGYRPTDPVLCPAFQQKVWLYKTSDARSDSGSGTVVLPGNDQETSATPWSG